MLRSDCAVTVVEAVAELFAEFGSLAEVTVAVLPIGDGPLYVTGTLYVAVIVTGGPAASAPIVQGKLLHPPPLTETGVRPDGVGSETVTPVAPEGPKFETEIV